MSTGRGSRQTSLSNLAGAPFPLAPQMHNSLWTLLGGLFATATSDRLAMRLLLLKSFGESSPWLTIEKCSNFRVCLRFQNSWVGSARSLRVKFMRARRETEQETEVFRCKSKAVQSGRSMASPGGRRRKHLSCSGRWILDTCHSVCPLPLDSIRGLKSTVLSALASEGWSLNRVPGDREGQSMHRGQIRTSVALAEGFPPFTNLRRSGDFRSNATVSTTRNKTPTQTP